MNTLEALVIDSLEAGTEVLISVRGDRVQVEITRGAITVATGEASWPRERSYEATISEAIANAIRKVGGS